MSLNNSELSKILNRNERELGMSVRNASVNPPHEINQNRRTEVRTFREADEMPDYFRLYFGVIFWYFMVCQMLGNRFVFAYYIYYIYKSSLFKSSLFQNAFSLLTKVIFYLI